MQLRIGRPRYGGSFEAGESDSLPLVLPGELVELKNTQPASLSVLEAAAQRVQPGCIHFGRCGGCQYQHASYALQLEMKRQIVRDLLAAQGLLTPPAALPDLSALAVIAGEPWGYRNRIRMQVRRAGPGTIEFGYNVAGSNEMLPVTMCPIAAPLLWRAVESLRQAAATDRHTRAWLDATAEVELFTDGPGERLQLQLWLREANPPVRDRDGFAALCAGLQLVLPELKGAGAQLRADLPRRARRSWPGAAWGAAGLNYRVGSELYWVSRGAFFQVNRFLVDRLVQLVVNEAGTTGGALAWDLFAGVGLFTRALAARFSSVVAVEGAEPAAADLAAAARGRPGRPGYEAVRSPTLDFLERQQSQRERPDVVVLDPPRAGLGAEGCRLLAALGPARIVYVSCDPVTLARDLRVLAAGGYAVRALHLVDLFPQTFHVETVVRLER